MSQATMSEAPETIQVKAQTKTTGRNAKGQFAGGNKGGPGNPFGRRMAAMREAIQRAIGVEDIEAIMKMLLAKSLAGDLAATRLLLQYAVGKPKPMVDPDRLDVEEYEIAEESWVEATRCTTAFQGVPVALANVMMGAMTEAKTNQLGEAIVNPEAAAELAKAAASADDEDDDDRPLTPEEIAEAKREWVEANARHREMVAAQDAADAANRPSVTERNGSAGCGTASRPCHSADRRSQDSGSVQGDLRSEGVARSGDRATTGTERPASRRCVEAIAGSGRTRNVNNVVD